MIHNYHAGFRLFLHLHAFIIHDLHNAALTLSRVNMVRHFNVLIEFFERRLH